MIQSPKSHLTGLIVPVWLALVLSFLMVGSASAAQPEREGMVFGLDPGLVLMDRENEAWPRLFRLNLRLAYGIRPWVQVGGDISIDLLMDPDGLEHFQSPFLIQPMVTFFPVAGFNIRMGGGFDPQDTYRWSATAGLGYEFRVHRYGGLGFGPVFTQYFHTDKRPDWRVYGIMLQFSAYNLNRDWFKDDEMPDPDYEDFSGSDY